MPTTTDDSITLHYQPLADRGGKVVGFEAMMRWHHQQRGAISPEAFMPVFEDCGVILPLSRWALQQACLDARSWKRPLGVSVHLSPVQVQEADASAIVAAVLAETGLSPDRLELEIGEAVIAANPGRVGAVMRRLAAQGVRLAFDNVTGGIELPAQVRDYPFSTIKIARGLVQNVEGSASARSLIHMIVLVGRSMNVQVAAKGVETAAQFAFLHGQGCDVIQGSYVSWPAPLTAFAGITGNVADDFVPGSTRLADGMLSIVPLHSGGRQAALAE